ncbi:MAG: S8 family peptidase, partial [Elusimicrobiales bacterium]|nr:S8 family peptidase [Elusimicrobiales bacterium]
DEHGHGTHVAGTIAAIKDDKGVVGVAPKAAIYGVKVLDGSGGGSYSTIIAGIEWCVDNGINVINMSLGGRSSIDSFHKAVKIAVEKGITVVCAAGNDSGAVNYPAKYAETLGISASTSSDAIAYFSSRGPEIDFVAPGYNVYSTYKGGAYKSMSGTSMACPHVAGLAALAIGLGHTTPAEVKTALVNASVDIGLSINLQGNGLIEAGKIK